MKSGLNSRKNFLAVGLIAGILTLSGNPTGAMDRNVKKIGQVIRAQAFSLDRQAMVELTDHPFIEGNFLNGEVEFFPVQRPRRNRFVRPRIKSIKLDLAMTETYEKGDAFDLIFIRNYFFLKLNVMFEQARGRTFKLLTPTALRDIVSQNENGNNPTIHSQNIDLTAYFFANNHFGYLYFIGPSVLRDEQDQGQGQIVYVLLFRLN